jgi:DNA primase
VFPVRDFEGQLVAVYGRALMPDQEPKYWLYPHLSADITRYFYCEHKLDLTYQTPTGIVLCEGPMDAIKLLRVTRNVLALFGTRVTQERLDKLKNWDQPITLCLDSDPAGVSAMNKIAKTLKAAKHARSVYRVTLPGAKDPWDTPEDGLLEALEKKALFLS